MKSEEINARIAEILGFHEYVGYDDKYSWSYPAEWGFLVNKCSVYDLPDFVGIIEKWRSERWENIKKEQEEKMKEIPKVSWDGSGEGPITVN